jgi:hypothetical protein
MAEKPAPSRAPDPPPAAVPQPDLLVHRRRGGTSAEVLNKSTGLDVTIRM